MESCRKMFFNVINYFGIIQFGGEAMTDLLCRLALKRLIDSQVIKEEDREIYEYGLTLLIATLGKLVAFIIIGLLTGLLKEIILFLVFFSGLRLQAGGYHANTVLTCFLGSLALIAIAIFFVRIIPSSYQTLFNFISLVFSLLLVIGFSPSESENRPLTKEERYIYKRRSILILVIGSIIIIFLTMKGDKALYYASIGSMGFLLESFTLINISKLRKINS